MAQFREKYIFAAVDRVAGELADRLPVWSETTSTWDRVKNLDGLGNGLPDPLPSSLSGPGLADEPPPAWEPAGILPEQFADEPDLARRADKWLTQGSLLDPRSVVRGGVAPWSDALVLGLAHFRRGHQGCIDQGVRLRAFGVRASDVDLLRRDAPFVTKELYDHGAGIEEGGDFCPALACWAPWLTWCGEDQGYDSFDASGNVRRVELRAAVGAGNEIWMPAPSLRVALGVAGFQGNRWCRRYVDRDGGCLALERNVRSEVFIFNHHYLAMDRSRYESHLADSEMIPVWVVRIWLEATPTLFMQRHGEFEAREGLEHHHREVVWLVIGDRCSADLEVIQLSDELRPWTRRSSSDLSPSESADEHEATSRSS